MLTQEQVDELDNHFDNFKVKLDNAITKGDTVEIYNDMVISLDEFGLLPDYMTVDEAQQLVTGKNYPLFNSNIVSALFENSNFFCLISGQARNSDCLLFFIPVHIGGIMFFGSDKYIWESSINHPNDFPDNPAKGWVKTNGLLGLKEWNGSFYGAIFPLTIGGPFPMMTCYYCGVVGFTGIATTRGIETSFIGFAPWVKIKNK